MNTKVKFTKQSLIDWQATIGKKPFAWITKESRQNFSVRFRGYEPQSGFATLAMAKRYVRHFDLAS